MKIVDNGAVVAEVVGNEIRHSAGGVTEFPSRKQAMRAAVGIYPTGRYHAEPGEVRSGDILSFRVIRIDHEAEERHEIHEELIYYTSKGKAMALDVLKDVAEKDGGPVVIDSIGTGIKHRRNEWCALCVRRGNVQYWGTFNYQDPGPPYWTKVGGKLFPPNGY